MNASMYLGGKVTVGFGNSSGVVASNFLEEQYHIVERMSLKPMIVRPTIRVKQITQYDLGALKPVVNRRRNQTVLKSLMGIDQESQLVLAATRIEQQCVKLIRSIEEERSAMVAVNSDLTVGKFVQETGATQVQAAQYMNQFNNDAGEAIRVYKQRMELVRSFSERNGIGMFQAHEILKANHYNMALFE